MFEELFQQADAELEREFVVAVLSVMIQQRGDNVSKGQVRQLQHALQQADHLHRLVNGNQTLNECASKCNNIKSGGRRNMQWEAKATASATFDI